MRDSQGCNKEDVLLLLLQLLLLLLLLFFFINFLLLELIWLGVTVKGPPHAPGFPPNAAHSSCQGAPVVVSPFILRRRAERIGHFF